MALILRPDSLFSTQVSNGTESQSRILTLLFSTVEPFSSSDPPAWGGAMELSYIVEPFYVFGVTLYTILKMRGSSTMPLDDLLFQLKDKAQLPCWVVIWVKVVRDQRSYHTLHCSPPSPELPRKPLLWPLPPNHHHSKASFQNQCQLKTANMAVSLPWPVVYYDVTIVKLL